MGITQADLREYIRHIQDTLGWTFDQLEERTGISRYNLFRYVSGRRFPRDPQEVVEKIRYAAAQEQRRRRANKHKEGADNGSTNKAESRNIQAH